MEPTTTTTGYQSPAEAEAALTSAFTPEDGSLTPHQQSAIKSAASLVPTPAVITSDNAKTRVENARNKLNEVQNAPPQPTVTPDSNGDMDIPGDFFEGAPDLSDQLNEIDTTLTNTVSLIDSTIKNMDARSASMMENIKTRFAQRRAQQENINARLLGGTTVAGIRSGRNRYATEIQDSIIAAQESAGLQRIAELDAQEQQLLLEAEAANDDKQYRLLTDRMGAYEKASKEKRQAVLDLFQITQQNEQLAIQKSQEARQNLIFEREQAEMDAIDIAASNFEEAFNPDGGLNDAYIDDLAETKGIDGDLLKRTIKQIEMENKASMPALVQEYEYAKNSGYSGSFMSYQNARASAGRVMESNSYLSESEAAALGLPPQLAGASEKEILLTFNNENPPAWFSEYLGISSGLSDNVRDKDWGDPDMNKFAKEYQAEFSPQKQWDEYSANIRSILRSSGLVESESGGSSSAELSESEAAALLGL